MKPLLKVTSFLNRTSWKVSDVKIVRKIWVLFLCLCFCASVLCVCVSVSVSVLRRPSLSGTPTVTFCSVHIHNVVAKKRDASTELLQFLHAKMLEHNVDFIGGDFNMSAFSTVSDVFSDPEFSAPGHSCLWGLGALDEQHRECTGFLIMPKRPYEWRVDSHGCYKFDNAALGLGPRDQSAHLPVFLHLRNTNLPGPSSIMRSEQTQQRRYDRKIIKLNVPRNDARDHAPGRQGVRDYSLSFEAF